MSFRTQVFDESLVFTRMVTSARIPVILVVLIETISCSKESDGYRMDLDMMMYTNVALVPTAVFSSVNIEHKKNLSQKA